MNEFQGCFSFRRSPPATVFNLKNEVTCPLCFTKFEQEEYDRAHAPAPVERSITSAAMTAYSSPLPHVERRPSQHQKNLFKTDLKKKIPLKKLPNRDLPTKYFGEYLDPNEVFRFTLGNKR